MSFNYLLLTFLRFELAVVIHTSFKSDKQNKTHANHLRLRLSAVPTITNLIKPGQYESSIT